MTPEQRREAIVAAAIPLLIERGGNVTTGQIAAAAGIAEGTVFRAFKDKQELLTECMHTGLRPDLVIEAIDYLPSDEPLEQRLTSAIDLVTDYMQHMWSLIQALQIAGISREELHPKPSQDAEKRSPRHGEHAMIRVTSSIIRLLEPERDALRLEPALAARMLMGLVFANRLQGDDLGQETAHASQLVDLFLHGAQLNTPNTKGDTA